MRQLPTRRRAPRQTLPPKGPGRDSACGRECPHTVQVPDCKSWQLQGPTACVLPTHEPARLTRHPMRKIRLSGCAPDLMPCGVVSSGQLGEERLYCLRESRLTSYVRA